MKTKILIVALFLSGWAYLVIMNSKTKEQQEETEFQQRMDDTSQIMHSEIKVQELGETYLYYRAIQPRYLNND